MFTKAICSVGSVKQESAASTKDHTSSLDRTSPLPDSVEVRLSSSSGAQLVRARKDIGEATRFGPLSGGNWLANDFGASSDVST